MFSWGAPPYHTPPTPEPDPSPTGLPAPPGFVRHPGPVIGLPDRTIPAIEAARRAVERRRLLAAFGVLAVLVGPELAWLTLRLVA
jgi:hypothetical protein